MSDQFDVKLPKFQLEQLFKALSQSSDWGIEQLKIKELWKKTKGEGITIAVLDTGCPAKKSDAGLVTIHPDLRNNILLDKCETMVPDEDIFDQQGHSTAVCGVIAAEDNELGFVGYAPEAKIITYKVLNKNGAGSLRWIENALKRCVETKPDIVSMSLGSIAGSSLMHSLVKKLDSMGIPVICAAGNGGECEGVNYPAKYDESFAIGAYDKNMNIADFSAIGNELDFAFPGVDIETTWINFGYTKISGTSFACPACTGLVALILSDAKKSGINTNRNNTIWIYNKLKEMATNPQKINTQNSKWGWGYIDIQKLTDSYDSDMDSPLETISDSYSQDLEGHSILELFTEEDIRNAYADIVSPKQNKQIYEIVNLFPDCLLPALLIHRLQYIVGGSEKDFKNSNKTLSKNLKKLIGKNYSIWNPSFWINRFRTNRLVSIYDKNGRENWHLA